MFPTYDTPEKRKKDLRKFGVMVGGIFALIGFWQLYRGHHETARMVLWSIGGLLIGFGIIAPTLLAPIYAAWMKFALVLGWVNSRILLSIIFFLMFTPVGLVMRLFGRDALERRIDANATSYWIGRQSVSSIQEHCERQY